MSNARRSTRGNSYRSSFLHSRAWHARRGRWFREELATTGELRCSACRRRGRASCFELHHHSYDDVTNLGDGKWRANEAHHDLIPMHPWCHEQLHKLLDRDRVLSRNRARPIASRQALTRLQRAMMTVRKLR